MMLTLYLAAGLLLADTVTVPDPGFEAGGEGWSLPTNFTVDTTVARSGSASLRVVNTDPAVYQLASCPVEVEAGRQYSFSCWVKTEAVEGNENGATICIEWSGPNGYLGGNYPAGPKGTSDWTQVTGLTAPIPAEATSVRLTLYLRRSMTGRAWFDDVEMAVHYPPPLHAALREPRYRGWLAADRPGQQATIECRLGDPLPGRRDPAEHQLRTRLVDQAGTVLANWDETPSGRQLTRTLPLPPMAAGEYQIETTLWRGDEEVGRDAARLVARPADLPTPKVYLDDHGRTLVDGVPFLPLGLYDSRMPLDELPRLTAAGFNCVMPYGIAGGGDPDQASAYLDAAEAAGLKVIYSIKDYFDGTQWRPQRFGEHTAVEAMAQAVVETFRDHPAVLAWYLNDELPTSYLPELTERYRQVTRLDDDHPCWVVLYQVGQLEQYLGTLDVLGTDPYPVPARSPALAGQWARRTLAARGWPAVWQVPQAHDWGNYRSADREAGLTRAPTLAELRSMTLQSLAAGAMGLIYYSYFDLKRDPLGFDARWADLTAVAGEVRQIERYILSLDDPPALELAVDDPDQVFAQVFRDGREAVLLIGNGKADQPATVSFRLPAGARPELLFGAAELTATGAVVPAADGVAIRFAVP